MKVAVEISGQPRVCELVSKFARQLVGADSVEWHIVFWQQNPRPDSLSWQWWDLIPDSWRDLPARAWVLEKFQQNLPPHHSVVSYLAADRPRIQPPQGIVAENSDLHSVYTMWRGWSMVGALRQQWEAEHGAYDLVIKARPDAAFDRSLDLTTVNPQVITIADGPKDPGCVEWDQLRTVRYHFSDVLFMGSSEAINIVNTIEHRAAAFCSGARLHPDLTLAKLLRSESVTVCRGQWTQEFRLRQPDFGQWIK